MKLFILLCILNTPAILAQSWIEYTQMPIRTTQEHGQRSIPIDIDNDGDMDLITSYSLTDEVVLELNMGNNNWQMIQVGANIVAMFAEAGDFDGDGDYDIVAVGLFDRNTGFNTKGEVIWYEQNGSINNWIAHSIDTNIVHPRYLDVADIDNDGDLDFAIISSGQDNDNLEFGNAAVWYENKASASTWSRWVIAEGLSNPESVRIGNIDGDSTTDILVSEYGGDRVLWFSSDNNPRKNNWAAHTVSSAFTTPSSAKLYDMDNDNDLDVVAVFDLGGSIVWFEHPQTLTNAEWSAHVINDSLNEIVEFTRGDFNNDDLLDFALGSFNTGYLAILQQQLNGSYLVHSYSYPSFSSVETADMDGDGDLDLVTSSYNDHRMDWWKNNHTLTEEIFINGFEN